MRNVIDELQQAVDTDKILMADFVDEVKGGYILNYKGVRGFLPKSLKRDVEGVNVLKFEKRKGFFDVIFSQADIDDSQRAIKFYDFIQNHHEGDIVKGKIIEITKFGAFVNIDGYKCLLPLSKISWRRVKSPSAVLVTGDEIEVKIIGIDLNNRNVSVSRRDLLCDPYKELREKFKEGDAFTGVVMVILPRAILVRIYKEAVGMLITDVPSFKLGQKIDVKIKKFSEYSYKFELELC